MVWNSVKIILQYTQKARKDLSELDNQLRERIILKLEFFCYKSSPMKHSKPLTGEYKGLYRFRIGQYRAIFHKDAKGRLTVLTVIRIKHRRDIYD